MKSKYSLLVILIISNLLFTSQINNVNADHIHVPFTYMYYWDLNNVNQDGVITANEYPNTFVMSDLAGDFVSEVSWGHDNTTIAVGIMINGTGWLGLGLGEVGIGMAGADIIMASVVDGVVEIQDMKATEHSEPIPDEDQYPFPSVGGLEIDGKTTVEFTIPMANLDNPGNDHFWHIGDEFGFFTAFRKTGDDFTKEHHAHSQSEDVLVLDASYPPPVTIIHDFTANFEKTSGEITLTSVLSEEVPDHEIGFFQKTLFGELKIDDTFTNDQGVAEIHFQLEKTGEFEFTAIFYGDENHVRNERTYTVVISEDLIEVKEKYHDLRDIVGPRFMRLAVLFGMFFVINTLLYVYATSIMSLVKINKIGKNYYKTESKIGEMKE